MDGLLPSAVSVAAVLGGCLGGRVLQYRLNAVQLNKLIAVLLFLWAARRFGRR